MGWSTKHFLLADDDSLRQLSGAAFTRMLKAAGQCRVPEFADQRVRMAAVTVELTSGVALGVRHMSFTMLDFDEQDVLDIQRLNTQQVARLDAMLAPTLGKPTSDVGLVEASSRFVARGGSWEPEPALRRSLEDVALGRTSCRRVKVLC